MCRPFEEAENGQGSPCDSLCILLPYGHCFRGKPASAVPRPHLGINALDAAAQAVNAVNAIHFKTN